MANLDDMSLAIGLAEMTIVFFYFFCYVKGTLLVEFVLRSKRSRWVR